MRIALGLVPAIAVFLILLAPAHAGTCDLSTGAVDDECYELTFEKGVATCADDITGEVGICDYQHRCTTCMPSDLCTEIYLDGFVGCQELRPAEASAVPKAGSDLPTGLILSGRLVSPITPIGIQVAAILSAAGLGTGIAVVIRKRHSAKRVRKKQLRALVQERKDLKRAKLDYRKAAVVLVAAIVGGMLAGTSQTGQLVDKISALSISGRWVILGLFAIAIIIYAMLCHGESKGKRR